MKHIKQPIVNIKPKKEFTIRVKINSIEKGKFRIFLD